MNFKEIKSVLSWLLTQIYHQELNELAISNLVNINDDLKCTTYLIQFYLQVSDDGDLGVWL